MEKILECFKFQKKYYCGFILILLSVGVIYFYPKSFVVIGEILNKYADAIIAISAILGVKFGSSWLDTSKKKMKGKLDYDIARKYLKGVLKIRDSIRIVRNPFIPVGEMQIALEKQGFKSDEYENKERVNRSVYSLRWNKIQEALTSFEEILIEAEISWGHEAVSIQKDLDKLIRELRSVVWLFINYSNDFYKKGIENHNLLYGTHDENDEFAKKINAEIEKIRNFLKKYL